MTRQMTIWFLAAACILGASCAMKVERKSASYYLKHKQEITDILNNYHALYNKQPFSCGFTDRSYKYFVMQIMTDTVRYIYNTELNKATLYKAVKLVRYDTARLSLMMNQMKNIKLLWMDKTSFWVNEKEEIVTFLSFKSVAVEQPFTENKYYILLFTDQRLDIPELRERLKKGDLARIEDKVYFMIGNQYR